MKKGLAMILTLVLLVGLLAGCTQQLEQQPEQQPTQTTEAREKLTSAQLQEIALAEAGAEADQLNSITIHEGEYDGKACVSVRMIIRDRDYEFVIDVYTGEVLLSVLPD